LTEPIGIKDTSLNRMINSTADEVNLLTLALI